MKFLIIIIPFLYVSLNSVNAECGTKCLTAEGRHHVCTGRTTFQICMTSETPEKITYTCPSPFVCVDKPSRCEPSDQPACSSGCGICNPKTNVACISKQDFAFCFNNIPNYKITGNCKSTDKCDSNTEKICTSGSDSNAKISCDSDAIVPPTPGSPTGSTPAQIKAFCQRIRQGGKFTPGGDITCTKYNYCYMEMGQITGKQYSCPGNTMFDCESQQCGFKCNNKCPSIEVLPPSFPFP